jgi:threonylcarbamoyladenosine tRNA methylthiotransferase MtaB
MKVSVSFLTFGCKLNQLETEALSEAFSRSGARVLPGLPGADDPSGLDLLVMNTCTVTAQAEARARRALRLAREAQAGCLALVTGCWAELAPEEVRALGQRVFALPGGRKAELLDLPAFLSGLDPGSTDLASALEAWLSRPAPAKDSFAFNPGSFALHSRPSLKVQDGCDNACAYCRVSLARGASVSLDPGLALERLQALEAAGAAEAVLTGVNLSQYSSGGLGFAGLLGHLLAGTSRIALRISSWEPERLDPAFLEAFGEKRIRPHLHLALQSGSDRILGAMGRRYTAARVLEGVEALRRVRDDPFIAADLIAGFPGEGEGEFQETLDLARAADLAWIQAFIFSPRPGTPAAGFPGKVAPGQAEERRARLALLAAAARKAYVGRWLGREVEAVVEGREIQAQGLAWRRATSDNYLRLVLPSAQAPGRGRALRCYLDEGPVPQGFDALGNPEKAAGFTQGSLESRKTGDIV